MLSIYEINFFFQLSWNFSVYTNKTLVSQLLFSKYIFEGVCTKFLAILYINLQLRYLIFENGIHVSFILL